MGDNYSAIVGLNLGINLKGGVDLLVGLSGRTVENYDVPGAFYHYA